MKKESIGSGEPMRILLKYIPVCWEEADYADECKPLRANKAKGYREKKEDSLVDFSDIVRN